MAICGVISKYGIDNFTLYILETLDSKTQKRNFVSKRKPLVWVDQSLLQLTKYFTNFYRLKSL